MPFRKGQSGNPGGRPKELADIKELARSHTAEAVERLAHWMRSDDARASVAAATALLDRAWGKAPASMTVTSGDKAPRTEPVADTVKWIEEVLARDISSDVRH
jgi:hypothetical protein